ncbi:DnaD domain protein [Neobacillus drentensis]|uniref:DnaD domain-containing protein n=1 Tax=Neobacillus drentensis TaxID=220684 RepID=UPI001F2FEE12|nr:DnaD domain protein [Neobacillus drentensis]ULT54874.1 DnaD domain protein [Neobacillus drentensis]
MAKYRMVRTDFWKNPIVLEEMTPEDKFFYLYLLTNPNTTQIGIYKITKKQIAFDLGYSIEGVHSLMERFITHHKLIRYNPETRELAIKNWGKDNLHKAGRPVMDCIYSELKEVEDTSLIHYVSETIQKQEIHSLYESFCKEEGMLIEKEGIDQDYGIGEQADVILTSYMLGKENHQQQDSPDIEGNPDIDIRLENQQQDVNEIIEFWDANEFGFENVNAKKQLLSWLDHSSFLQPKEMILKAMIIACANNKRRLSYVVGILKNWENESILTVEDIDAYQVNQKFQAKYRQEPQLFLTGSDIPSDFVFDVTDGEDWRTVKQTIHLSENCKSQIISDSSA